MCWNETKLSNLYSYTVSCDINLCEIPYNDDRSECSPLPLQKRREEK